MAAQNDPVIRRVITEQTQGPETRRSLLAELEHDLGRPVLSYFTSFIYPVSIEDADVDMVEGMLRTMDLSKGLALLISSPGGNGIAAERIVNLCRRYSGTGEFWSIVPSRAKSAATMVCFGSSKIMMGPASELGPIDPQLTIREDGKLKRFSVWNLLQSYKEMFDRALKEKGNLQPFLQQLANYDCREMEEYKSAMELSEDIAIRSLASGMIPGKLTRKHKAAIRKKIAVFLTPKQTKAHGRPIYSKEAQACGLTVDLQDVNTDLWARCYELYVRTNNFVSSRAAKCVENKDHSFFVSVQEVSDDRD